MIMIYSLALILLATSAAAPDPVSNTNYANAGKKALLKVDVAKDGSVDSCEVLKTSGDAAWDLKMCNILAFNKKLKPTLNAKGRPIASTRIVPIWQ
jgi:hypothetical protein